MVEFLWIALVILAWPVLGIVAVVVVLFVLYGLLSPGIKAIAHDVKACITYRGNSLRIPKNDKLSIVQPVDFEYEDPNHGG